MILIDLPMPEACDVCPFNYDFCCCEAFGNHDEWEKYSDDWNDNVCDRETRPEYCPLKEQAAVVRCKDCKKRDSWECWQYFLGRIKIPDDWYCADGVAKDINVHNKEGR